MEFSEFRGAVEIKRKVGLIYQRKRNSMFFWLDCVLSSYDRRVSNLPTVLTCVTVRHWLNIMTQTHTRPISSLRCLLAPRLAPMVGLELLPEPDLDLLTMVSTYLKSPILIILSYEHCQVIRHPNTGRAWKNKSKKVGDARRKRAQTHQCQASGSCSLQC